MTFEPTTVSFLAPNLVLIRGKHSIKAGIDMRLTRYTQLRPGSAAGTYDFNRNFTRRDYLVQDAISGVGAASFLLGYPASDSVANVAQPYFQWVYYAPWAWRLGTVGDGPSDDTPGTRAPQRRFRFPDRGTGSDHAKRWRHGRTAAIFAEFEREILRERTRAGLAQARLNGKRLGRPITAGLRAAEIRNSIVRALPKQRSPAGFRSAGRRCSAFWADLFPGEILGGVASERREPVK